MGSTVAIRVRILVVALALLGAACGGSGGGDDHECSTCTVSEDCKGDQECVLAVDDQLRCFEPDEASCTLDRVEVGRAPTPSPTPIP